MNKVTLSDSEKHSKNLEWIINIEETLVNNENS